MNWYESSVFPFLEIMRKNAAPENRGGAESPGRAFGHRRGDRATRRISGERFLMPDTTPMAMYSVTTEDPP